MLNNTKVFVVFSFLIILLGFSFLWFGLRPETQQITSPPPTPISQPPPIATTSATFGVEGERKLVTEVIDGDTIKVEGNITVRLIGIDTPETKDPRKPVGCFGKEAANETKSLLSDNVVILQKDVSETDKYGRLLKYIFLPLENGQILFVNDYLVREGFAKVLTYPPDVKYNERLRQAEKEAKDNKRGLWGMC